MARYINNKPLLSFPRTTSMGSQAYYISHISEKDFQPMNTNFGIFMPLDIDTKKADRKTAYVERAIKDLEDFKNESKE